MALRQERVNGIPLFEGQQDHFLPSTDSRLLRTGVFKIVGKFMAHAAIHCGIGFIGLSLAACEYLTTHTTDSDTPFTLTVEDVPDDNMRACLTKVTKLIPVENCILISTLYAL